MKNKTKIDVNIQFELIKMTTKRLKIIFIIVGLILMLIGAFVYRHDDILGMIVGLGLAFGGLAVIVIFALFWEKFMFRLFKNNNQLKGEIYNYYEFDENNFYASTFRDEENIGKTNMKYSDITKVIENKSSLALFISNTQAFVVSKNEMTEGSIDDLIILIKSKTTNYHVLK